MITKGRLLVIKTYSRLHALAIIMLILTGCSKEILTIPEPLQTESPPTMVATLAPMTTAPPETTVPVTTAPTTSEAEPSEPRATLPPVTFAPVNISPIDPPDEEYFIVKDARGDSALLTLSDVFYRYYLSAFNGGVLIDSWESANDIHPSHFISFFVANTKWIQATWEDIHIPAQFFEPYIMRYFDVESDHLKKARHYNADDNTYELTQYPVEYSSKITDVSTDDNILTIDYEQYGWDTDDTPYILGTGRLKIEIIYVRDYFRYVSNEFERY